MIKPVGALCNLDCGYCYYLPTQQVFDRHEHRMTLRTLEDVFASVLPRFHDDVTIAWQGGEPTLAGLDFFHKAIEFQEKYRRPSQRVHHALQTNGTLLTDDWCRFLKEHGFLIGLSVDGPARLHDRYRLDRRGRGSFDTVERGLKLLQKHAVEYNVLCVINDVNVHHPDEVLAFLLNCGARWVQFIPAIEWVKAAGAGPGGRNELAPFSPKPGDFGRFLCRTFDLWHDRYRQRVSIRDFDAVLNRLVLGQMPLCILDGACHNQLTIEHDGSVFGCDHFVERRWQLARIGEPGWRNALGVNGDEVVGLTVHGQGYALGDARVTSALGEQDDLDARYDREAGLADPDWYDRVDQARLGHFAARKQHLPEGCRACEWQGYCYGGCPKHRSMGGEIAEPTVLCESYKTLYGHAMPRMRELAAYLRAGRQPPPPVPAKAVEREAVAVAAPVGTAQPRHGRNDPCPCGSGLKYKRCHGRST